MLDEGPNAGRPLVGGALGELLLSNDRRDTGSRSVAEQLADPSHRVDFLLTGEVVRLHPGRVGNFETPPQVDMVGALVANACGGGLAPAPTPRRGAAAWLAEPRC